MSSAQYLVRFDDICPSMNWAVWAQVESILIDRNVKPILAVVPDNKDGCLEMERPNQDFWQKVRSWQERGWAIGLHGYEHRYETADPGIVGINRRSEFAGLSREVQAGKLQRALAIFRDNGVTADVWVAPGHSFDATTVELLVEFGVKVISDGYYLEPVVSAGAIWVPQQLWRFRSFPKGLWTVCYHTNTFRAVDIAGLALDLDRYGSRMTNLETLLSGKPRGIALRDKAFAWCWRNAIKVKQSLVP